MNTPHTYGFPLTRLLALGWDDGFALSRPAEAGAAVPARVLAQHRGSYRVAAPEQDVSAILSGRFHRERTSDDGYPAVGDWVELSLPPGGGSAAILQLLPRRSVLRRRRPGAAGGAQLLAANVDLALIAASIAEPLNARRLERYVTLAWDSGAVPLVVLTKLDLCANPAAAVAAAAAVCPGTGVVALSTTAGIGLDALLAHLRPRRTAVVLGPSGVGKSTLINALLGEERLRTLEVLADGRGRHTTTHRELFRLPNGALLIDTPGLREVGLREAEAGLRSAFEEIDALAEGCRFGDCRHRSEPGCAVRAAVEAGRLEAVRLEGWQRLEREMEYLHRRNDPLAAARATSHTRSVLRSYRSFLRQQGR